MRQKILITLLVLGLLGVSAAWGYSEWSRRTATVRPPPKAAVATLAPPAPAAAADTATTAPAAAAPAEGTRFLVEYIPPENPALDDAYQFSKKLDLYTRLPEVAAMSGTFEMPQPLKLVTAECRQINAFYDADKHELVLCYEMIDTVLEHGDALAREKGYDDGFAAEYLLANLRFIMLHEMGHALIDILDLSSTGREEDAADQLATTLMVSSHATDESPEEIARHLHMAASFFMADAETEGGYDLGTYADEHSLGEQRYFNVLCLLYGSDPGRYLPVVTHSGLPEARAMRCPDEAKRVTTSWARLLAPHFAPRYQLTAEQAQEVNARAEAARREHAETPYVRGDEARAAPPSGDDGDSDVGAGGDDGNPYTR